jgi:hypothetical protein
MVLFIKIPINMTKNPIFLSTISMIVVLLASSVGVLAQDKAGNISESRSGIVDTNMNVTKIANNVTDVIKSLNFSCDIHLNCFDKKNQVELVILNNNISTIKIPKTHCGDLELVTKGILLIPHVNSSLSSEKLDSLGIFVDRGCRIRGSDILSGIWSVRDPVSIEQIFGVKNYTVPDGSILTIKPAETNVRPKQDVQTSVSGDVYPHIVQTTPNNMSKQKASIFVEAKIPKIGVGHSLVPQYTIDWQACYKWVVPYLDPIRGKIPGHWERPRAGDFDFHFGPWHKGSSPSADVINYTSTIQGSFPVGNTTMSCTIQSDQIWPAEFTVLVNTGNTTTKINNTTSANTEKNVEK